VSLPTTVTEALPLLAGLFAEASPLLMAQAPLVRISAAKPIDLRRRGALDAGRASKEVTFLARNIHWRPIVRKKWLRNSYLCERTS
jgi:hypothetical protein